MANVTIVVAGCGGLFYHGISGFMTAFSTDVVDAILLDPDVVERRNALRQWAHIWENSPKVAAARDLMDYIHGIEASDVQTAADEGLVSLLSSPEYARGLFLAEDIVWLALTDNRISRIQCLEAAEKLSLQYEESRHWFATAGNDIEGGMAWVHRIDSGKLVDETFRTRWEDWFILPDTEGPSCAQHVEQSTFTNLQTVSLLSSAIMDMSQHRETFVCSEWSWGYVTENQIAATQQVRILQDA